MAGWTGHHPFPLPWATVHTPSDLTVLNVSPGKTRNFAKNIVDLAICGTTIRLRYLTRPPSPPPGNQYRNGQLEDKYRGKNRHVRGSLPVIHYRYMLRSSFAGSQTSARQESRHARRERAALPNRRQIRQLHGPNDRWIFWYGLFYLRRP